MDMDEHINDLPWSWSRPYKTHSGKGGIRIVDAAGRVVMTGYCQRDEDADRIVNAVNATALMRFVMTPIHEVDSYNPPSLF